MAYEDKSPLCRQQGTFAYKRYNRQLSAGLALRWACSTSTWATLA